MNKGKEYFTIISILIIYIIVFKYNYILNTSIMDAMHLWLTKLFPSLFIMFILSNITITSGILKKITSPLNNSFNRIFKTNGDAFECVLISIISGCPTSSLIIKEMLNNTRIDERTANNLLTWAFWTNPLFLYKVLTIIFNKSITFKIIIAHYITPFIIGITSPSNYKENMCINNNNFTNPVKCLPKAINEAMKTMLMILGTITFYMIITNLITVYLKDSIILTAVVKGLLEITQGLNSLINMNGSPIIKEIIALTTISFGGLSIHTQVNSIISDSKLNYKYFLLGRIKHTLYSLIIFLLLKIL